MAAHAATTVNGDPMSLAKTVVTLESPASPGAAEGAANGAEAPIAGGGNGIGALATKTLMMPHGGPLAPAEAAKAETPPAQAAAPVKEAFRADQTVRMPSIHELDADPDPPRAPSKPPPAPTALEKEFFEAEAAAHHHGSVPDDDFPHEHPRPANKKMGRTIFIGALALGLLIVAGGAIRYALTPKEEAATRSPEIPVVVAPTQPATPVTTSPKAAAMPSDIPPPADVPPPAPATAQATEAPKVPEPPKVDPPKPPAAKVEPPKVAQREPPKVADPPKVAVAPKQPPALKPTAAPSTKPPAKGGIVRDNPF
jgi:hypothetical protein